MAKYPHLTTRPGSRNLCYKRTVPLDLRAEGRPSQIWRSLKTPDQELAKRAYAAHHAEVEAIFESWRREDSQQSATPAKQGPFGLENPLPVSSLTPSLLRRLADDYYLIMYEHDFRWRGDLWQKADEDEEGFWSGAILPHPKDDWQKVKGQPFSYYAHLMEEPALESVFLYCIFMARKDRLLQLKRRYQLGDSRGRDAAADTLLDAKQIALEPTDRARLFRKLMEVEIRVLEDLTAGDETTFDLIVDRQVEVQQPTASHAAPVARGELMSVLIEKYLDEVGRQREWPSKTALRKRGELQEFLKIAGDKPVNGYRQEDGVKFKDTQLALPATRQQAPFKGLSLEAAAEKASDLRRKGEAVDFLNPITIKDKIGTVSLFFVWAKTRNSSVINPVADQRIVLPRNKRAKKKRHPWSVDELNKMFAAPIYTGCHSERYWKRPGDLVLRQSAKFWVPLIALYSGMRLGEIIQMQVADIKELDGIGYFDVTPVAVDADDEEAEDQADEEEKSLKTSSSRRAIPIHQTLFDLGFRDFLELRKSSSQARLFPEYEKAKDDGSWSKQFSKYFRRFRDSIGVKRRGVKFHSLRHNVEDALRNADVRKEVRDAIQGHGESGVSREYGSGYYVTTLAEAVQKIKHDGLVLPKL